MKQRFVQHQINPSCTASQVLVKFKACPVNPADINQIQGTYPVHSFHEEHLGYLPGNEGLAQVIQVGSQVKNLKVGDWVLPSTSGFGTWRSHAMATENDFLLIERKGISDIMAATVTVNPCTAYRMIQDFVPLSQGDVLIQNGANSGVGQAVIQFSKLKGIKTINVVRTRPNLDGLKSHLHGLGADLVITEDELRTREMTDKLKTLGEPKLAFNCVGGKSATNLARLLGHGGYLITYGAMSKEPITLPNGLFIFKNIQATGFWMTHWYKTHSLQEKKDMVHDIFDLSRKGQFKEPPVHSHVVSDLSSLENNVLKSLNTTGKHVILFQNE